MPINIKLNYLYRDYSNYKRFGTAVFENSRDLSLEKLTAIIKSKLIDGEYFSADEWNVPNLFFETRSEDDHNWHEFESLEYTEENADLRILPF